MVLLDELKKIQRRHGYLKESELLKLSKKTGIPISKICGTASFYSFFRMQKAGKHVIRVCDNLPCLMNGSENILKYLEKKLGILTGETTKDSRITLEKTSCIGCCNKAPAMMVDEKLYVNLDEKKVDDILKKLK